MWSISGTAPRLAPSSLLVKGKELSGRRTGVFGLTAVEFPAHSTHHRHHLLSERELPARAFRDHTGGFDVELARRDDSLSQTQPGVQLRAVQAQ